jgi:hypothetical protein
MSKHESGQDKTGGGRIGNTDPNKRGLDKHIEEAEKDQNQGDPGKHRREK